MIAHDTEPPRAALRRPLREVPPSGRGMLPPMAKHRALAELIARASPATSRLPQRLREVPITAERGRVLELESLLHLRDGFRTLDGALIVRPSCTVASVRGADEWNALTLWRGPYRHTSKLYFFAEDVHGRQFALHRAEIVTLDPASGAIDPWANDLEGWAARALGESERLGSTRVRLWQAEHGPLGIHQRLQPKDPAALELDLETELRARDDIDLMKRWAVFFRAFVANPAAPEPDPAAWWGED